MKSALAPYRSPEQRVAATLALGEVVEYGRSVRGESLLALRFSGPSDAAPRVLCSANIHGPEFVGCEVALRFAERMAEGDPLREHAEVWVIPCLNPDGYRRTWDRNGVGPLPLLRPNDNGVDLNRNFMLPPGARRWPVPGSGSPRPGDATYRGTAPLSEPETAALHDFLCDQGFHASANLHSFMGSIIPARVTDAKTFRAYVELHRAFAAAQPHRKYRRLSNRIFDVFTGEQEDHQHHRLGTWAVCVEVFPIASSYRQHLRAPSTFWRFNPHDPDPWLENDVPGLVAYFEAALDQPAPAVLTQPR